MHVLRPIKIWARERVWLLDRQSSRLNKSRTFHSVFDNCSILLLLQILFREFEAQENPSSMIMDPKCSQPARQSRRRTAPIPVPSTQVASIQPPVRSYIGSTCQHHGPAGKARNYSPPPGRFDVAPSRAHTLSELVVQQPARAYTSQRARQHDLSVKAKRNSPPPTPPPRKFNLAERKALDEAETAERILSAQTQGQDSLSRRHDNSRIFTWLEKIPEHSRSL